MSSRNWWAKKLHNENQYKYIYLYRLGLLLIQVPIRIQRWIFIPMPVYYPPHAYALKGGVFFVENFFCKKFGG